MVMDDEVSEDRMECCFPVWEGLFGCNTDLLESLLQADTIRLGRCTE